MNANSNSFTPANFPQTAYLVAGKTVAAVVLGIEVESLRIADAQPEEWEITIKFASKSREASMEEFAIIEICGRWAAATVTLGHPISQKDPTTRRGIPPDWLDKQFVESKAEFIATNYYVAIKQVAEQLKERRFMNAADIREAIHDGPAIACRVH
jgi:hypothetical protein